MPHFIPDQSRLQELRELYETSTSSAESKQEASVRIAMLEEDASPDVGESWYNHCAYVFANASSATASHRENLEENDCSVLLALWAGWRIKKNFKYHRVCSESTTVQDCLMLALSSRVHRVRALAAVILAQGIKANDDDGAQEEGCCWSADDVLGEIRQILEQPATEDGHYHAHLGAFALLHNLEDDEDNLAPFFELVLRHISPSDGTPDCVVGVATEVLRKFFDLGGDIDVSSTSPQAILESLILDFHKVHPLVQGRILEAIVETFTYFSGSDAVGELETHLGSMIDIALEVVESKDVEPRVKSAAFSFWSQVPMEFSEAFTVNISSQNPQQFFHRLVTALMSCMEYTQPELAAMEEAERQGVSQVDEKLWSKIQREYITANNSSGDQDQDDFSSLFDMFTGEDGETKEHIRTLRQEAALALDTLAGALDPSLSSVIFMCAIQRIQEKMLATGCDNWIEREAAILAIGALSEGNIEAIMPFFQSVAELLCQIVGNPEEHPLIRSISAWSLNRFICHMLATHHADSFDGQTLLHIVEVLLRGLQSDDNLHVFHTYCSSLADIIEATCSSVGLGGLGSVAEILCQAVMPCFDSPKLVGSCVIGQIFDIFSTLLEFMEHEDLSVKAHFAAPLTTAWELFFEQCSDTQWQPHPDSRGLVNSSVLQGLLNSTSLAFSPLPPEAANTVYKAAIKLCCDTLQTIEETVELLLQTPLYISDEALHKSTEDSAGVFCETLELIGADIKKFNEPLYDEDPIVSSGLHTRLVALLVSTSTLDMQLVEQGRPLHRCLVLTALSQPVSSVYGLFGDAASCSSSCTRRSWFPSTTIEDVVAATLRQARAKVNRKGQETLREMTNTCWFWKTLILAPINNEDRLLSYRESVNENYLSSKVIADFVPLLVEVLDVACGEHGAHLSDNVTLLLFALTTLEPSSLGFVCGADASKTATLLKFLKTIREGSEKTKCVSALLRSCFVDEGRNAAAAGLTKTNFWEPLFSSFARPDDPLVLLYESASEFFA